MGENASWGIKAELAFIDGISEHSERGPMSGLSFQAWLLRYIVAHEKSPHSHHLAGVSYAKRLLRKLERLQTGHLA